MSYLSIREAKRLSADRQTSEGEYLTPSVSTRTKAIKLMIEDFIDLNKIDLVLLGSVELSNLNGQQLGSVSEGVAKRSAAHTCIVKNFAYTW